jgi:murein DD-endopeptidase MepM/ murein hydrolase activator NlpD
MKRIGTRTLAFVMTAGSLAAQPARLTVAPARPDPGSLVRLTLDRIEPRNDSLVAIRGTMAGEPLHFVRAAAGAWHAIGGIPVDVSDSIPTHVVLERLSGAKDTIDFTTTMPHVPPPEPVAPTPARGRVAGARRLTVDQRFTQPLDAATEARVERENLIARNVGRQSHESGPLWSQPFLRPRPSTITSRFGSGRVFNGRVASRHLGIDFRGAVGEPVYAANRGIVALVASFFLAGHVVYIDHGAGVVTGYFHLSEQQVAIGDTVERGQQIGLVGSTGRVTGPHLHWSARYGTLAVDPMDLVALANWYSVAKAPSARDGRVVAPEPVDQAPARSLDHRPR